MRLMVMVCCPSLHPPSYVLLPRRHGGRLVVQFECGAAAFTCVATAFNRLSLVKGLVRY